eukprot:Rhum_TRINITY_DN3508_c0_g3::Rhum_TRINITY_DN3508_c0_g3_i1::g.11078::m.11078
MSQCGAGSFSSTRCRRSGQAVPSRKLPWWTFIVGGSVWVGGSFVYMMWSEEEAKNIRRKGILKDILREEKRVAACTNGCDSGELIEKLKDDGFSAKYKKEKNID